MSAGLLDQLTATAHNSRWMAEASCVGLWDTFDPGQNGDTARSPRVAAAAAICHTCPVIDACHQSAQTPTVYGTSGLGVRAGLLYGKFKTPSIIPVRDPDAICGTLPGLANHHSRRESPCDPCRVVAESIRPVETLPAVPDVPAHGTPARARQHYRDGEKVCADCFVAEQYRTGRLSPDELSESKRDAWARRKDRLRLEQLGSTMEEAA